METGEENRWTAFTLLRAIGLRESSFRFRLVLCLPLKLLFQLEMMRVLSLVPDGHKSCAFQTL